MCEREMDGALFKTLLESGCRSLKANVRRLNDLNVFPIPDGDTGDNMFKTLYGGFLAIKDAEGPFGALVESFMQNGVFCGEISMKVTVRSEKAYWYIGLTDAAGRTHAFLMDGASGEVLAAKDIFQ